MMFAEKQLSDNVFELRIYEKDKDEFPFITRTLLLLASILLLSFFYSLFKSKKLNSIILRVLLIVVVLYLVLMIFSLIMFSLSKRRYVLDNKKGILTVPDGTVFPIENTKAIIVNRKFALAIKNPYSRKKERLTKTGEKTHKIVSVPIWEIVIAKTNSGFSILRIKGKKATDNSYQTIFRFADSLSEKIKVPLIDNTGNKPFEYDAEKKKLEGLYKKEIFPSIVSIFSYKEFLVTRKTTIYLKKQKNSIILTIKFHSRNPNFNKIIFLIVLFQVSQIILLLNQYNAKKSIGLFNEDVIIFVVTSILGVLFILFAPLNFFNVKNVIIFENESIIIKKINGLLILSRKISAENLIQVNSMNLGDGNYLVEFVIDKYDRLFLTPLFDEDGAKKTKAIIEEIIATR